MLLLNFCHMELAHMPLKREQAFFPAFSSSSKSSTQGQKFCTCKAHSNFINKLLSISNNNAFLTLKKYS